jgi:dolichol-phosphate mannosyltransferase
MTVIVPLRDEADGVAALARRLASLVAREAPPRRVDLVLVDDGSTDETAALLEEHFADAPALILRHPRARGLGAALATGLEVTSSPLVGWLDADLTYDPAVLLELAAAVDAGADVAVASCHHPGGKVEGVPRWRVQLSAAASALYRRLTGADLHTFTCMVRVYRREVLERCRTPTAGFAGVTEVLLQALWRGYAIAERPATLSRRRAGRSKLRVLRVGLAHLWLMARCWRRARAGAVGRPASR